MLIKSLILSGNRRLLLNNIKEFRYNPTSPFQLILGTNGSGKTTVLRECSPLPAVSSDYVSGGSKVIVIEHEGDTYTLSSILKGSGAHSFKNGDGDELNPGGTGRVQRELIKQVFNYTQDLHDLLCGDLKFTHMSPGKRREWITEISDINLDYALGVYDRLRSRSRDTSGALKHIKGRLTTETAKLLDFAETENLEKRGMKLREELDALFQSQVRGNGPTSDVVKDQLWRQLEAFEKECSDIVQVDLTSPLELRVESLEALREHIEQRITDKAVLESTLARDQAEYDELRSILKAVGEEDAPDPATIEQALSDKGRREAELLARVEKFLIESDPLDVMLSTKEALPSLVEVFQRIPDNSDGTYTREKQRYYQGELERLRREVDKVVNQESRLASRLEHITHSKDTTCPRCDYEWKEGVNPGEKVDLEKQVKVLHVTIDELRAELLSVETKLEDFDSYSEVYGSYRSIVSNYPRLRLLWDYILDNKCLTHNPKSHMQVLYQWEREVELSMEIVTLRNEMRMLSQTLEQLRSIEGIDTQYSKNRYAEVGKSITQGIAQLDAINKEIDEVRKYERLITHTLKRYSNAEAMLAEVEESVKVITETIRQEHIGTVIYSHQGTLSIVEQKVREKATQMDIVNDLTASEETLSKEAQALKLILNELSPSEGLIAEQLKGFIDCLIGQMNDVIEQVWTYDLTIQPCGMDGEELDYYFPMKVKSESVQDIKFGSTAQVKMVNFAFQLAVMTQLNMTHHPLLLDELGEGFDEQHGTNLMTYIKALIDAGRHSQMLLINHHSAQWGIFAGAEICVLDTTNVTVPQVHNKHVQLM